MTERKRGTKMTRRRALKAGAAGFALTAAAGIAPKYLFPRAQAAGLAPGMVGGPTGFAGAERYQYDENNAASRAVEGMKKLKAEGKAPDKIVMACLDGAVEARHQRAPGRRADYARPVGAGNRRPGRGDRRFAR